MGLPQGPCVGLFVRLGRQQVGAVGLTPAAHGDVSPLPAGTTSEDSECAVDSDSAQQFVAKVSRLPSRRRQIRRPRYRRSPWRPSPFQNDDSRFRRAVEPPAPAEHRRSQDPRGIDQA